MNKEEILREFFSNKPGYLKSGVKLISKASGITDHKLIKRVKKELSSSVNYGGNRPTQIQSIGDVNITPELIEALQAVMAKGQFNPMSNGTEQVPLFAPKPPKDRKVFKEEGIHLLMGCNHVPFHNKELHKGIRSLIRDLGGSMVGFHIMGDFCDINALSSHDRGKFTAIRGLTLESEYDDCNVELDKFEDVLAETVIDKSFLYGNHEDRVHRYNKDMQNAKNPAVLPHDALKLRERGYAVHTKWMEDYITIGNGLDIFHGIYYNIHNAKKHLDVFKGSCAYVHTHRSQMYREGAHAAYNIGGCADYDSAGFNYATRAMKNAWANGFAIVNVDKNGDFYFTQIDVKDGRFFYNGKKY